MPTYSYACKDCGHAFDIVQSFKDDSLTECPSCQGSLRKLFNSVGIVFKGSGFYRNDSRSGSGSTSSGTSSSDSTTGKTEPKPAASESKSSDSSSSSSSSSSTSSSSTSSSGSSGSTPAAKAS